MVGTRVGAPLGFRGARGLGLVLVLVALLMLLGPLAARAQEAPAVDPAELPTLLGTFEGAVLVPPVGMEPFAGLPIWYANSTAADYQVLWQDAGLSSQARVSAFVGQPHVLEADPTCPLGSTYCAGSLFDQPDAPLAWEAFSSYTVRGAPAVVQHATCCNGQAWSVTWWDAAGVTYSLGVFLDAAAPFGTTIAEDNRAGAEQLVALAEQLVPLTGP